MRAKLIKVLEHYHLYDGDKAIATTIVGNPMLLPNISLKNCQAIERDYDLDVLAENKWNELSKQLGLSIQDKAMWCGGFKHGLLEILGDKKFSEGDMEEAFADGQLNQLHNQKYFSGSKAYIQSLQQTEWDVEIEMGNTPIWEDADVQGHVVCKKCGEWNESQIIPYNCKCVSKPKLDANGCLILKRK